MTHRDRTTLLSTGVLTTGVLTTGLRTGRRTSPGRFAAAAAMVLASGALAQVAPPPPPPPQPEPEFVPPPTQVPRATPTTRAPRETGAVRMGTTTPARDTGAGSIPNLRYNKMAQEGDDGLITRIDIPLHYKALQHNPTIGVVVAEVLDQYLVERRVRFEELLFANYADLELLESGLLDDLSIFDTAALTEASQAMKNLVGPTTLSQELQSKEVISPMQARFNNHLVREYEQDVRKEIEREFGENAISEQLQFMFDIALQEVRDARDGMLLEALTRLDSVYAWMEQFASESVLSDVQRADIDALRIESYEGIDQREAMDNALRVLQTWDTDQQRSFLRAVANSRPDRFNVPMIMIDITEGKRVTFRAPPRVEVNGVDRDEAADNDNDEGGNGDG